MHCKGQDIRYTDLLGTESPVDAKLDYMLVAETVLAVNLVPGGELLDHRRSKKKEAHWS